MSPLICAVTPLTMLLCTPLVHALTEPLSGRSVPAKCADQRGLTAERFPASQFSNAR